MLRAILLCVCASVVAAGAVATNARRPDHPSSAIVAVCRWGWRNAKIQFHNERGQILSVLELSDAMVADMDFDQRTGELYVFSDAGIYLRRPNGAVVNLGLAYAVHPSSCLAVAPTGILAVANGRDAEEDLQLVDPHTGERERVCLPGRPYICDMAFDGGGALLMYTDGGLFRRLLSGEIDRLDWLTFKRHLLGKMAPASHSAQAVHLSSNCDILLWNEFDKSRSWTTLPDVPFILDMATDPDSGTLWFFTDAGLFARQPNGQVSNVNAWGSTPGCAGSMAVLGGDRSALAESFRSEEEPSS